MTGFKITQEIHTIGIAVTLLNLYVIRYTQEDGAQETFCCHSASSQMFCRGFSLQQHACIA